MHVWSTSESRNAQNNAVSSSLGQNVLKCEFRPHCATWSPANRQTSKNVHPNKLLGTFKAEWTSGLHLF
eukprot:3605655-Alexandrium_andersonii.AAC.1